MSSHILLAHDLDSKGAGTLLNQENLSENMDNDNLVWVHLDSNNGEARKWLESEISHLDPFVIDALLTEETRPRMTQIGDGAILILRGANLNENAAPEDMVSVRLWIEKNRVISVQRRQLKAITDIEEMIKAGRGPKDTGEMVCMLMECLLKRIEPVLSSLDETTDNIEEALLESGSTSLRELIVDVRKQAIMFRRYMIPQREAIDNLRMSNLSWLSDPHRRQIQENYNHITRYLEDLDAIRERAQIVKDELVNMLSDKLNKNMYILSIISAIFIPLGFLTGLLGINVGGIPGVDNDYAFAIFGGVLIVILVIQIIIFRWLKWF